MVEEAKVVGMEVVKMAEGVKVVDSVEEVKEEAIKVV